MRNPGGLVLALLVCIAWAALRLTLLGSPWAYQHHAAIVAPLSGGAILAAAFLLAWGGEVAQLDVSQSLALAFLAFVAVLPEYSVDMYFSWKAGRDPGYAEFPVANMTGANRLLIGVGWPAVLLVHGLRSRETRLALGGERRLELGYLLLATLYSLVVPLKGTLSLVDALFLVGLFAFYMRAAGAAEHLEPELGGTARWLADRPPRARRVAVVALFVLAAAVILLSVEPFAESLLASGRRHGVSEFLLVQWVAPVASEAPEFVLALLFAWKGFAGSGIGTLVSSKVNQWTLLVGLIPVAYAASVGAAVPFRLSPRQSDELLLTSAQSAFAIAVMADLRLAWWEAALLLGLFAAQFAYHESAGHRRLALLYLGLTALLVLSSGERRRNLWSLLGVLRRTGDH